MTCLEDKMNIKTNIKIKIGSIPMPKRNKKKQNNNADILFNGYNMIQYEPLKTTDFKSH